MKKFIQSFIIPSSVRGNLLTDSQLQHKESHKHSQINTFITQDNSQLARVWQYVSRYKVMIQCIAITVLLIDWPVVFVFTLVIFLVFSLCYVEVEKSNG